jgi:hypothetical protein
MHYTEHDLFHLAQRVAGIFPVPGAADLLVRHVVYALQDGGYHYLFTAEYTVGGAGAQQRLRRTASFCEKDEAGRSAGSPITLASANLPLEEQYQELRKGWAGEGRITKPE